MCKSGTGAIHRAKLQHGSFAALMGDDTQSANQGADNFRAVQRPIILAYFMQPTPAQPFRRDAIAVSERPHHCC